ncbi:MAG: ATP-grasp domain-containing protein [Planctomycetota bacterium]
MANDPLRLLVLFQGRWEDEALTAMRRDGDVVAFFEGFEPLSFGGLLRGTFGDARRWTERLVRKYRGRIDAVWSNDEPFGCLLAAAMAKRLGLPGAEPAAIVRAQHKVLLREALAEHCPELTVRAAALSRSIRRRAVADAAWIAAEVANLGLSWPLFVKPAKATFSVLARRVADARELAAHLRLSWLDRRLLTATVRPFQQLASEFVRLPCGPAHPLLETPLHGHQVNVDGYAWRGDMHVLGEVDEWMYPGEVAGARHFAGFVYPSRQAADTRQRLRAAAIAAVRAIGYDHGMWNVELFVRDDGDVKVIEINPRSAGQFASLYGAVLGLDLERMAVALAAGRDPGAVPRLAPTAGAAASFVFRCFDGRQGPPPRADGLEWLARTHPGARLWTEPAGPRALRREYRWLGSHRHAVLNLAAADFAALVRAGDECGQRLFGTGVLPGR